MYSNSAAPYAKYAINWLISLVNFTVWPYIYVCVCLFVCVSFVLYYWVLLCTSLWLQYSSLLAQNHILHNTEDIDFSIIYFNFSSIDSSEAEAFQQSLSGSKRDFFFTTFWSYIWILVSRDPASAMKFVIMGSSELKE